MKINNTLKNINTKQQTLALLFFASIAFFSCQTKEPANQENIVGYYETSRGSLMNKLQWVINNGKFSYNNSHRLRIDSNYIFSLKGCKCEAGGKWFLNKDTLIIVNKQMDTGKFLGSCKEEFTFKYVIWEDGSLFQVFPDYEMITLMRKINNRAQSSNKQSRL